jgi:signal transduction histidine kinase
MQAPQSSTASGSVRYSGNFVALRHISRQMEFGTDSIPGLHSPVVVDNQAIAINGIAECEGLAHDVGNLLGALGLYSDLLAMPGVLHDEHREYAADLRLISDRSWAMIDRLLNHARGQQRPKIVAEPTVLPEVIDQCRGVLSRIAGRTVEIGYGAGAFEPVHVTAEAVERIVANLVKNAAEATPWAGTILIQVDGVVESAQDGNVRRCVRLSVQDRGRGMDSAAMDRLMQGEGASANGRGLGFRVVRELVALSGGCLSIESQPGMGTSVAIEWNAMPEVQAPCEVDQRAPEVETMKTDSELTGLLQRDEVVWIFLLKKIV